jgi:DHA2 family multidrug resistance protein
MAITSIVSLVLLVLWETHRKNPIVDLRLLAKSNFAVCFVMMLTVGLIIYGSTQVIPQLLQEVFGYTATDAGLALTMGGIVSLLAMPVVGILSGKVQARWLLAFAFIVQALAMGHFTGINTDVSFGHMAVGRMYQAIAIPFLFVPINAQAYAGLDPSRTNQASALMNVARNLGGSIGISSMQTIIERREQFHQARIVEGLNPLNPSYVEGLNQIGGTLAGSQTGADPAQSQLGVLYQFVSKQAAMLSYLDAFHLLMLFIFCMVPLTLFLKPVRGEGGA